MNILVKLVILMFVNALSFVIHDFQNKNISERPHYVCCPSFGSLIGAFLMAPLFPFIMPMLNLTAGKLGRGGLVMLAIKVFYTVAIYYFVVKKFSIGSIIAFILSLVILRKTFK